MPTELTMGTTGRELRVLDPDLPFLASEAAVDIDNLIANKSEDLEAIRQLGKRLRNSMDEGTTGAPMRSLMDPATLSVLGEAVAGSERNELHKIGDLLLRASRIADVLSLDNPKENIGELVKARDFCIAFSKAALAYRRSIRELSSSHPFRR